MMEAFRSLAFTPRVLQSIFGSSPIGSGHDQGIYVELSLEVLTGVSQNVGGP